MKEPKVIPVENGGRKYWMIEGVAHLFESKQHAINYSQLYPKETGPWKWQQDIVETQEKLHDNGD